jgi:hypothetical protein
MRRTGVQGCTHWACAKHGERSAMDLRRSGKQMRSTRFAASAFFVPVASVAPAQSGCHPSSSGPAVRASMRSPDDGGPEARLRSASRISAEASLQSVATSLWQFGCSMRTTAPAAPAQGSCHVGCFFLRDSSVRIMMSVARFLTRPSAVLVPCDRIFFVGHIRVTARDSPTGRRHSRSSCWFSDSCSACRTSGRGQKHWWHLAPGRSPTPPRPSRSQNCRRCSQTSSS